MNNDDKFNLYPEDNHNRVTKLYLEVSLEVLHHQLWQKSMSAIAKDWNISAQSIRKACDKFNIPRPQSGHWTLVSLGKAPIKISLPKNVDESLMITIKKRIKAKISKSVAKPNTIGVKQKLAVAKRVTKLHPLSVLAKQHYKKPMFEHDKLMVSPWQIETYQFAVSPEKFDRALKIFDALVKYFDKQGWKFEITDNFTRRSKINAVVIDGKTVTFKLREKTKQTPRTLNKKEEADKAAGRYVYYEKLLMPIGMFHLTIEEYVDGNCKTAFIDKPCKPIEEHLDEFVDSLVAVTKYMKQRDIKRANEEEERLKQQELNDFFNKEVQKEKDNIAFIFEQFGNWQKAEKAREFIAVIKQRINDSGDINKEQEKWLLWAEHILTIEDPVAKAVEFSKVPKIEDELTQNIDALAVNEYFNAQMRTIPPKLDRNLFMNIIKERIFRH